jgi:hypothetical protein
MDGAGAEDGERAHLVFFWGTGALVVFFFGGLTPAFFGLNLGKELDCWPAGPLSFGSCAAGGSAFLDFFLFLFHRTYSQVVDAQMQVRARGNPYS